ncbi:MAG: enoyl-CoA hydratase/isomerase family protein [Thermoprotei archaeon]
MYGITIQIVDDIGFIAIDTGGTYNLVTSEFMVNFVDALTMLDRNPNVRFVVVHGAGDNLGAGADVNELYRAVNSKEFTDRFFNMMKEIYLKLFTVDKFVIGYARGVAYGASMEMLLAMDYVIAHKDSRFAAPGGRLGVYPPVLLTMGPERIGWAATRRMAFLGEVLNAEQAKQVGLVDEVTEETDPVKAVQGVVGKARQMAPSSIAKMRKHLYRRYYQLLEAAFEELKEQLMTRDTREGVTAFLTNTKPYWAVSAEERAQRPKV